VLLHYEQPAERLTPEAALRYRQIKSLREARDDHRYAATLEKLVAKKPGMRSDRIAAEYRRMLDELPAGRGPSAFPPHADSVWSLVI
jgi:hypothetical protein